VRGAQSYIPAVALAVLWAALSPSPAWAKQKPKENGFYDVTISGYYRGSGKARASATTVSIDADVKDDAGAPHRLTAHALPRDPERHYLFSGRGTLDGMEATIDGRVDVPDPRNNDVLKKGRIVFTFKVIPNGRHGRGGGEKRGGGNSNPGGGGNPGGGNPGGGNPGDGDSGNGNPGGENRGGGRSRGGS
jgi:hypothetical protein